MLVVNPYEAECVKNIFKWYLEGETINSIHDRLEELGFHTKYKGSVSHSTIKNILCNPLYIGSIRFKNIVVENAHEPIISEEQFQRVQFLFNKKKTIYSRNNYKASTLLTGMIFCKHCGARYAIQSSRGYEYYTCYSRSRRNPAMVKDPNCQNKIWKLQDLENVVEERILELLRSPEMASKIAAEQKSKVQEDVTSKRKKIEKKINEIDRKIGKLMELYQVDGISPEVLADNIDRLYSEKKQLQAALEKGTDIPKTGFNLTEAILKDAAQIWDFADLSQKRRILQDLVDRIIIDDENVEIEWSFAK